MYLMFLLGVVVASESGVDFSKPTAMFIHELLNLSPDCEVFDIKFACLSGSIALFDALNFVKSAPKGTLAAIVLSDISRYEPKTSAELTQGAGSVAIIVGENPELISLNNNEVINLVQGKADFYRPVHSFYSIVHGKESVENYLLMFEKTMFNFLKQINYDLRKFPNALLFHSPYPALPIKASKLLQKHSIINDDNLLRNILGVCLSLNLKIRQLSLWISLSQI